MLEALAPPLKRSHAYHEGDSVSTHLKDLGYVVGQHRELNLLLYHVTDELEQSTRGEDVWGVWEVARGARGERRGRYKRKGRGGNTNTLASVVQSCTINYTGTVLTYHCLCQQV